MSVKNGLLLCIVLLAGYLRLHAIGDLPQAFSRDEAALGYNAFSLYKTGKDEYGVRFPLILNSFNDNKPAVYSYFSIPFVALGGLNETTTRMASAVFGTVAIIMVYLLIYRLTHDAAWGLLGAGISAISPWLIEVNRTASEASLAFSLSLVSLYLIFHSSKLFRWFGLFLTLTTFFTYHTPRLILPSIIWGGLYWGIIKLNLKQKILLSGLTLIGIYMSLVSSWARIDQVSIFTDLGLKAISQEAIFEDGTMNTSVTESRLFHNRIWYLLYGFTASYLKNSNLTYLFLEGAQPPRANIPETGQFQLIFLPFFLMGFLLLVKKKPAWTKLIYFWTLISVVPAALTNAETPNTYRTLYLAFPIIIFIAYGFVFLYRLILNRFNSYFRLLFYTILVIVVSLNTLKTWHQYRIHSQTHQPWYRQYGYRELIPYLNSISNAASFTITNSEGEPYIYYLFYNQINPKIYQEWPAKRLSHKIIKEGQSSWQLFNYTFTENHCPHNLNDTNSQNIYVVAHTCSLPENYERLHTINFMDGNPEFFIDRPRQL